MVIDWKDGRTRIVFAFALAIAIHEIALFLVHGPATPADREDRAVATTITIQTTPPTPRPTPKPTPTPKPPPPPTPPPHVVIPPHVTPAPVAQVAGRAKGHPAKHRGGGADRAIAKAHATTYAEPNAHGGTGTSTGAGTGNVAGVGGGQGGNGAGDTGNGNGAVNAEVPCGAVDFIPYAAPHYENGTAYEPVQATVSFRDGHQEKARFPYRWVYPSGEQNDPWSDTNQKNHPDMEVPLQFPPPGADTSGYDPLIKYILSHTDPGGFTDLPDCPKGHG